MSRANPTRRPINDPLKGTEGHRWDLYCQHRATGLSQKKAAAQAGISPDHASRVEARGSFLKDRIIELVKETEKQIIAGAAFTYEFVDGGLRDLWNRCRREEPSRDSHGKIRLDEGGNPLTKPYDMNGAIRVVELIGRRIGAFSDNVVISDADQAIAKMGPQQLRDFVAGKEAELGGTKQPAGQPSADADSSGEEATGSVRTGGATGSLH